MAAPTRHASKTFTFRLGTLFPPSDPLSVPMLRLMAAVNDVRHLRKLIIVAFDAHDHAIGTSERLLLDGEIGYLQRMLCGHLHEAGIAFRGLQQVVGGRLDRLLEGEPAGTKALADVRFAYMDESQSQHSADFRAILGQIRTFAAFHYKNERFLDVLTAAENEDARVVVVGEAAGLGRHTVTDTFATRFVIGLCGGTEDGLGRWLAAALTLAGSLEDLVEHLLSRLLDTRPGAVVAVESDEVIVPEALERYREEAKDHPQ